MFTSDKPSQSQPADPQRGIHVVSKHTTEQECQYHSSHVNDPENLFEKEFLKVAKNLIYSKQLSELTSETLCANRGYLRASAYSNICGAMQRSDCNVSYTIDREPNGSIKFEKLQLLTNNMGRKKDYSDKGFRSILRNNIDNIIKKYDVLLRKGYKITSLSLDLFLQEGDVDSALVPPNIQLIKQEEGVASIGGSGEQGNHYRQQVGVYSKPRVVFSSGHEIIEGGDFVEKCFYEALRKDLRINCKTSCKYSDLEKSTALTYNIIDKVMIDISDKAEVLYKQENTSEAIEIVTKTEESKEFMYFSINKKIDKFIAREGEDNVYLHEINNRIAQIEGGKYLSR